MFSRKGLITLILCVTPLVPGIIHAVGLSTEISGLISSHGFTKSNLGVYIIDPKKSVPVVAINSKKLFTPASVVKVATTYAALLELGADYRWPLEFYKTGTLKNGTLNGDIVVKSFGNPDLVTEDLEAIVSGILKVGIKKITGNLIIDRSYFTVPSRNSTNFDKNTHSPYNATADAMMFNHRASLIKLIPDKKTGKVEVLRDLPDSSFVVLNHIKASKKSCRGNRTWPRISFPTHKGKPAIKFEGTYSLNCPSHDIYKVITSPHYMFYHGLKFKLAEKGVFIKGSLKLSKVPKTAKHIFIFYSRPLIDIIAKINKKSNNVMARQTLLTLGGKQHGIGASYQHGVSAINSILKKYGVISKTLKIENGSGLSRSAKLDALTLANLLKHAYKKYGAPWLNTLAVMGIDGTLKRRLQKSDLKGRAWMKTGSLKNTRSIIGYIKVSSDKTYIVAILLNAPKAKARGLKLQDEILKRIYSSL